MKTASSLLKQARAEKKIALNEAAKVLKIHPRYLQALESGDFAVFSSTVHLKGFLKNYAAFLGLNIEEVLAFWRRDYNEEQKKEGLKSSLPPLADRWLVLTPSNILFTATVILIAGFFGYLIFQYRSLAGPPPLEVLKPPTDLETASPTLSVEGKTDREAVLTINGQKVLLDQEGKFSVALTLSSGLNTLSFEATSKLGKKSTAKRTVFFEGVSPTVAEASPSAAVVLKVIEVRIAAGPEAVWIEVFEGAKKAFEGILLSGSERTFKDNQKVKVKSGNAGSTQVFINGQDEGRLGKPGEVVEREFYPQ